MGSAPEASQSQIRVGEVGKDPKGPDLQSLFIVGNCDLAEQMIFEKLRERNPHLFPVMPDAQTPTGVSSGTFAREWKCPTCNFNVFASREMCYKCGTGRPVTGGTPAMDKLTQVLTTLATPVPTPAEVKAAAAKAAESRSYWMCRKCGNMNHSSRPQCNMCKTYKPGSEPIRDNQLLLRPAPWD